MTSNGFTVALLMPRIMRRSIEFYAPADIGCFIGQQSKPENALIVTAGRMAEEVRVQIGKHHQASVKGQVRETLDRLDEVGVLVMSSD